MLELIPAPKAAMCLHALRLQACMALLWSGLALLQGIVVLSCLAGRDAAGLGKHLLRLVY